MAAQISHLLLLLTLYSFFSNSVSLTQDGAFLLAFRYNILSDPLSQLQNWNYYDPTPCSWTGVTCDPNRTRVISLALPGTQLLGSLAPELGLLDQLQNLDLSNNFFNGTLPETLFNASRLQNLTLAENDISGEIPASIPPESPLTYVNLSDNALAGSVPRNLSNLRNLTVVSLKGNYFSGALPRGFRFVKVLDLSSNLFNGSLPSVIGGEALGYLNLSSNKFSGALAPDFGTRWPENATLDLSYNNLTGRIPDAKSLVGQKPDSFAGNPDLCGKPLKQPCVIPSTLSTPPNVSSISPAIAVIPRALDNGNSSGSSNSSAHVGGGSSAGMKPIAIVGITVADLAGIGLLALALFYLYQWRKRRAENSTPAKNGRSAAKGPDCHHNHQASVQFSATPSPAATTACCCIKASDLEAATTDGRTSSDSENNSDDQESENGGGGGRLVMLDGETEMDMETLMKASAYILGASGVSIVYKAVLQDGTTFTVRRLGEGTGASAGGERLRKENFESQVRAVAKLRHGNVATVRGFYWGSTEKLVISDYVSNGSLASISCYKKNGSSPCHLSLEVRLKIARGVARGLIYIHDKKFVHGNLKPSNILLTQDMEPVIGDLGINWIIHGCKGNGSGRQFGSKRAMVQYDTAQEVSVSGSPLGSANGPTSPYQAPELLKSLKASPKWDVYSFGVILLELLTGKVFLDKEVGPGTPSSGFEDKYWALRMADVAIRADVQGKEEAVVGVFKLGFQCASMVPHKRPSMKEALQVLEKVSASSWQMMI
ncbi:hypothetical protein V2J09_002084 [Rumex salicifolius]